MNAFTAPGGWYKGNLHMHTTNSDGKLPVADAVDWYKQRGYDFISVTDHRNTTDTKGMGSGDFLLIPGMELDCVDEKLGAGYHILGIGIEGFAQPEETRKGPGQALVDLILRHNGVAILAHPYWLGQDVSDMMAVKGAIGMEVYNTTCARPGKAFSMVHWDGLLDKGVHTWGFATDDAHRYEDDAGGGWIMVKAPELSQSAIMTAIKSGHFYSTQGPAILDVHRSESGILVHASAVREIRLIANRGRGRVVRAVQGETLTSAKFDIPKAAYARVEVVDGDGRHAWSQAFSLA